MAGEKVKTMTAEKIIELTTATIGHLTAGANENALKNLYALRETAAAEIRRKAAKSNGSRDRQKTAEKVLKNATKLHPLREFMKKSWKNTNGLQCFMDGVSGYRLHDALPLEEDQKNIERFDIDKCIENAAKNEKPLDVPDVPTLRTYIKTEKAVKKARKDRTPVVYDFGEGLPAVNAEYLLNALEILPGCVCRCSSSSILHPLYFVSAAGDALVCPVRK